MIIYSIVQALLGNSHQLETSLLRYISVFSLLIVLPASAETIIQCGSSGGWAYYFGDTNIEQKDEGWMQDGISKGGIALTREGNDLDILMKDSIGMMSVKGEGATVQLVDAYGAFITVLVSYPQGSKEMYTFDIERKKVSWSQHKFGVMFDKVSTMIADCQ